MSRHLPEPDAEATAHGQRVAAHIRDRIAAEGPLPFARFMELALYAPGLGYYSAGSRKFGAAGDLVTAPELGPAFAHALAHCLHRAMSSLPDWQLLEIGGGSGALAVDLLRALAAAEALPARYAILDISADLRERQREAITARCPELLDRVVWLDTPPTESWHGALIANEVIDALPATRFELAAGGTFEETVSVDGEHRFVRGLRPAPPALVELIGKRIGDRMTGLPLPYRSELHAQLAPWLADVTATLQQGLCLFVDYGYPRHEYYLPERRDGTLVCHYRHHAHGDPLWWPGLQDITAFVDFTALAEAADACGLEVAGYTSQAQFLIGNDMAGFLTGVDALPLPQRMTAMNAIKQLMLPGSMGERFQVMALTRQLEPAIVSGFDHDLRYRL